MAYFRCAFSNSGATLTVECDSFMAGAIVICSNGVKTLQGLCPSTSPYEVTFKIPEEGTWVVSTVVSGATYSTSVDIDFSFEASLSGFNWMRWLTEGGLDLSDYNDLSEVLADEKALRQLNLVHASVDYMASIIATHPDVETIIAEGLFAKWANLSDYALDHMEANAVLSDLMDEADLYGYGELIEDNGSYVPKGNVPVMTGNTAPYGKASATQNDSTAFQAFIDDGLTTWWQTQSNSAQSLQIDFVNPINIKKLRCKYKQGSSALSTLTFKYSTDGSTWTAFGDIYSSETTSNVFDKSTVLDNPVWALHVKVEISFGMTIYFLQFYGRELKVSVPIMTSNTAPYGEASASTELNTDYKAFKAFNGVSSGTYNQWTSATTDTNPYIGYDFGGKTKICMVGLLQQNVNYIQKFKIQAYIDNAWEDASGEMTYAFHSGIVDYFYFNSQVSAEKWRINTTTLNGVNANVFTLQFYGKDYSEKEFANDGSKWLYDHGVELEEVETLGTGTIEETDHDVVLASPSNGLYACFATSQTLDLTNYSLVRCKIFNYVNGTYNPKMIVGANQTGASAVSSSAISSGMPNNCNLDISAVNQNCYVLIASDANGGKVSVSEWWLE